MTYPFSYNDCQSMLNKYERIFHNHSRIYFHRELLTTSLDGRRLDLITITGRDGKVNGFEESIPSLFPQGKRRCLKFNKPTIFVTARVHPGETQGSHMINGLISFLLGL